MSALQLNFDSVSGHNAQVDAASLEELATCVLPNLLGNLGRLKPLGIDLSLDGEQTSNLLQCTSCRTVADMQAMLSASTCGFCTCQRRCKDANRCKILVHGRELFRTSSRVLFCQAMCVVECRLASSARSAAERRIHMVDASTPWLPAPGRAACPIHPGIYGQALPRHM